MRHWVAQAFLCDRRGRGVKHPQNCMKSKMDGPFWHYRIRLYTFSHNFYNFWLKKSVKHFSMGCTSYLSPTLGEKLKLKFRKVFLKFFFRKHTPFSKPLMQKSGKRKQFCVKLWFNAFQAGTQLYAPHQNCLECIIPYLTW